MARPFGSYKIHEETQQYKIYERYINSNLSLSELAKEFNLSYSTVRNHLHAERKLRGLSRKRTRF